MKRSSKSIIIEATKRRIDPEGFILVSRKWKAPSDFTGKVKNRRGNKFWYKDGQLHREDGPAVENRDGSKIWYKNGLKHREDCPAAELADGSKFWYKNGELHREDGPAVEWADTVDFVDADRARYKEWWYNGVEGIENFPPELKKNLVRKFIHGT